MTAPLPLSHLSSGDWHYSHDSFDHESPKESLQKPCLYIHPKFAMFVCWDMKLWCENNINKRYPQFNSMHSIAATLSLDHATTGCLTAPQSGSVESFQFKSHLCPSVRAPEETTNVMMSVSLPTCLHLSCTVSKLQFQQGEKSLALGEVDRDNKSHFYTQEIYQELQSPL